MGIFLDYPLRGRIFDYRNDPYFPTSLPLAVVYGVRDHVRAYLKGCGSIWYNGRGVPRALKPSNFDNPITDLLNRTLFDLSRPGTRELKLWERVLLALGF